MTGTNGDKVKVVLGAEYDKELWSTVLRVLRDFGATEIRSDSGVAGSQELQRVEAKVAGGTIIVEGETYVGLSITGEPNVVAQMVTHLRGRPPHGSRTP